MAILTREAISAHFGCEVAVFPADGFPASVSFAALTVAGDVKKKTAIIWTDANIYRMLPDDAINYIKSICQS